MTILISSDSKKIKVAFFDIDGTIRNKSLMESFVDFLRREGYVSQNTYNKVHSQRKRYKKERDNLEAYENYTMLINQTVLDAVKNLDISEVEALATAAIKEYDYEDYVYSKRLLDSLRGNGYETIAISGSIGFLVEPFSKLYEFSQFRGHGYRIVGGRISELSEPVTWKDKHLIVDEIIRENNWSADDILMFAVGDTAGDFTMLERATYPIAINPSEQLIRKMQWSATQQNKTYYVVYERKGVPFRCLISPENEGSSKNIKISNSEILLNGNNVGIQILDNPGQFNELPNKPE